jgi:hypothetical protein
MSYVVVFSCTNASFACISAFILHVGACCTCGLFAVVTSPITCEYMLVCEFTYHIAQCVQLTSLAGRLRTSVTSLRLHVHPVDDSYFFGKREEKVQTDLCWTRFLEDIN